MNEKKDSLKQPNGFFDSLPKETTFEILSFLNNLTLSKISGVSRSANELVKKCKHEYLDHKIEYQQEVTRDYISYSAEKKLDEHLSKHPTCLTKENFKDLLFLAAQKSNGTTLAILIKHVERILFGYSSLPLRLLDEVTNTSVKHNNLSCFEVLVKNYNSSQLFTNWRIRLDTAVENKNTKMVELILSRVEKHELSFHYKVFHYGASSFAVNDKLVESPLHFAVRNNSHGIVSLLAKTDLLELLNSERKTPLSLAVELQDIKSIEILLNQEASFLQDAIDGGRPYEIYELAMDSNNPQIIDLFKKHLQIWNEKDQAASSSKCAIM